MNEELSKLLTDLFIGATFDGEEVLGINFARNKAGSVRLGIRCATHEPYMSEKWHDILLPSAAIHLLQERLASEVDNDGQ